MAKEDGVFLIVGAYASPADARADYEIVKDLHVHRVIGGFDAAVSTKDADGEVTVNKDETATLAGGATAVNSGNGLLKGGNSGQSPSGSACTCMPIWRKRDT